MTRGAPPFRGIRPALWKAALAVLILDQASKFVVVRLMGLAQAGMIDVLPPWLRFRMAWNEGINFGLLAGRGDVARWVLIGVAVAISALVLSWIWRDGGRTRVQVSAGILVGGAMGNVLDRLLYGAVADFLNMSCCGIENPFAFNIADIAIFAGALGLVLWSGRAKTP